MSIFDYGEGYFPKGSNLDYGEDNNPDPHAKVKDPSSAITKQTVIDEASDGTKTTTTVENKTNNPKWRGKNPSEELDAASDTFDVLDENYFTGEESDFDRLMRVKAERPLEVDLGRPEVVQPLEGTEQLTSDLTDSLFDQEVSDSYSESDFDQAEINNSPAAKEIVTAFQDNINSGADPEQELKRFVDSSGHLKEWRPKLFKSLLGTLVGVASGESMAGALQTGFGAVGEEIAQEAVAEAEIAREDRKHQKGLQLKGVEALGTKAKAQATMLKHTNSQIASKSDSYSNDFYRGLSTQTKKVLESKVPSAKSAWENGLDRFSSLSGISKADLVSPKNKKDDAVMQVFRKGMSDWMMALRTSADRGGDVAFSSSPDAFIEARVYHSNLKGNMATDLISKEGFINTEELSKLRSSTEILANASENYINPDEVLKALHESWAKLPADFRKENEFLEYANSQVHLLK